MTGSFFRGFFIALPASLALWAMIVLVAWWAVT